MKALRYLAVLTLLPLITIVPHSAAQAPGDPTDVRCEGVGLAPQLTGDPDVNPDGTPVRITPDGRGKFVPVLMVHGWTGRSTHDEGRKGVFSHKIDLSANQLSSLSPSRSMVGQIQRIPGTAVFTFDYHDHSALWVDDQHIGPALGMAIDCLFEASGEKVIILAHSMGGLATRYALGQNPGRSNKVSTVVTFGTPHTGSLIAALGDVALDIGAIAYRAVSVIRLILATCGQLSTTSVHTGTLCDFLPEPARAFDSEAGRALRQGSPQLAALQPYPRDVKVVALAGDTALTIPKAGWFRLPWEVDTVPIGDLVVMTDSATKYGSEKKQTSCAYQLNPVRAGTDQVALALNVTARNDVAQPITSALGACFHSNLMRAIELTNVATGVVNEDVESRRPQVQADPAGYQKSPGLHSFDSPSGRFLCGVLAPYEGQPGVAACQGSTTPIPPKPADCRLNWGGGMYVDSTGKVDYVCAGGLMLSDGNAKVLPYGATLSVSGMTCTSETTGMRCVHDQTGHGFRVAAESNETF
jgi:pimeloyl-ACP methyl ester carboxylesterase